MIVAVVLVLVTLGTLLLEAGLAIVRPAIYESDGLLGWRLKANVKRSFAQKSLDGSDYDVLYETTKDGLRTFGANPDAPIRILVLGDSFTIDPFASNDRMWYARMARELAAITNRPAEDFYVAAGGAGGYGTYQNVLLADQLKGKIRPTVFVLQFCSNDFMNNHLEWESSGIVRNQYLRRPYAHPGSDAPTYVRGAFAWFYRFVVGKSRVLSRIDGLVQERQFASYGDYTPPLPPQRLAGYEREAAEITRTLLAKLRAGFSGIPALMVNCDGTLAGPNRSWPAIAEQAGFIPIAAPSDFFADPANRADKTLFAADGGHLSDKGNQLFGKVLAEAMGPLELIKSCTAGSAECRARAPKE